MVLNDDAIAELAREISVPDKGSSSHWNAYHAGFEFKGGKLGGVQGFGAAQSRGGMLQGWAHRLLQTPFLRFGREFPDFERFLSLGKRVAGLQDRNFDLDWLRHVLTASLLERETAWTALRAPVVVIGDGFASLASLFHAVARA